MAPGAKVVLYTSAGTVLSDGLYQAGLRAVEDNQVSVISLSYASCEALLGAAGMRAGRRCGGGGGEGMTVFGRRAMGRRARQFQQRTFAQPGWGERGGVERRSTGGGRDGFTTAATRGSGAEFGNSDVLERGDLGAAEEASLLKAAPEQVWNNAFG